MSFGSIRQWHWISSAVCLVGMLLFALTGITLNNATQIKATLDVRTLELELPASVLNQIEVPEDKAAPLPKVLGEWLMQHDVFVGGRAAEWSEEEVYVSLPRPGGDGWLSLDLNSGELLYEYTDRGWISFLNDLHKGRNAGTAWSWFLDVFSVACIIFCITGLVLLYRHSGNRPSTWPLVGLGLVIPVVLIILFIH